MVIVRGCRRDAVLVRTGEVPGWCVYKSMDTRDDTMLTSTLGDNIDRTSERKRERERDRERQGEIYG